MNKINRSIQTYCNRFFITLSVLFDNMVRVVIQNTMGPFVSLSSSFTSIAMENAESTARIVILVCKGLDVPNMDLRLRCFYPLS